MITARDVKNLIDKHPNKNKRKWLKIAEVFLTPFEERSANQIGMSDDGLCFAIPDLSDMSFVLNKCNPHPSDAYWWDVRPFCYKGYHQPDDERGLLACFLATMPGDIYKDFMEDL